MSLPDRLQGNNMKTSLLRSFPAVLAITLGAFGLSAQAQPSNAPAEPAARPASAANDGVVNKTKRVAKRAANATKRGANRAAGAVRSTGEKIGDKLPPGPKDDKMGPTGQPKTAP
jgi:hypothetical protein